MSRTNIIFISGIWMLITGIALIQGCQGNPASGSGQGHSTDADTDSDGTDGDTTTENSNADPNGDTDGVSGDGGLTAQEIAESIEEQVAGILRNDPGFLQMVTGEQGDPGPLGDTGPQGEPGEPGLSCWDLDGDDAADADEDINEDGIVDAQDCRGDAITCADCGDVFINHNEADSVSETMLQVDSVTDTKIVSIDPSKITPQGPGSLLDADTIDGLHASELLSGVGTNGVSDHGLLAGLEDDDHPQYVRHNEASVITQSMLASGSVTNVKVVSIDPNKVSPQGAGSGLDADTLDGLHASEIASSDDVWRLAGNSGTTPGTDVLGTTDNVAFEIVVNSQTALRVQPNATSPNLIAGHSGNSVTGGVAGAAIGGGGQSGFGNAVNGNFGAVGGGRSNTASTYATVGGGIVNTASGERSFVGGGTSNTASASHAVVAGGDNNSATGSDATVGGGFLNTASGQSATVPGGDENTASGDYSFAAGRRATADHNGSVVWGDSDSAAVASSAHDQWTARMQGGYRLFTNSSLTTGVRLAAGSGSWSSVSDRNAKDRIQPVDARDVLARLAGISIQTWSYKSQNPDVRHIGPMAQDFHAAFGVGLDDRHITTIDADGVAFAAIQALNQIVEDQQARIAEQQEQLDRLEERLNAFQRMVKTPRR